MARPYLTALAAAIVLSAGWLTTDVRSDTKQSLKPAASFASIADKTKRAEALFVEAGKVITHPRCVNCHPATDRPLQGMSMRPHQPEVIRGDDGLGAIGMRCTTCHGPANFDDGGVPGHPQWHLAPQEMAWAGKSLAHICAQIKDPKRNGGKTLAEIVEHMSNDSLVGWGWAPGAGREPAPGTQKEFGEIIKAWADAGAACPAS